MVDQPLTYRSAMVSMPFQLQICLLTFLLKNHARRMADALFLLDTKAKIAAMPAQAWNEYRTALST